MKNKQLIEEIRNKYAEFQVEMPIEPTISFTKDDITMEHDVIAIQKIPLSEKAKRTLLKRLRVQPDFPSLGDKLRSSDWSTVTEALKLFLQDRPYLAKVRITEDAQEIFEIIESPIHKNVSLVSNDEFIDIICNELESSKDAYKLFESRFDKKTNSIIIGLINEETQFNVFGSSYNKDGEEKYFDFKNDTWMAGVQFKFTETSFTARHLLERLICANGMTTKEESFVTHVAKKSFTKDKIGNIIKTSFEDPFKQIVHKVAKQANILKNHNVSIREFYETTKPLIQAAKQLDIVDEIKEIFDDTIFFSTFGENVKEKSFKWQATANSGLNAYKFFSALTYTVTHLFADVDPGKALDLQLKISNFFFKEHFDLDEIAENKQIQFNTKHIAFN